MKAGCAAQKLQFEAHGKRDVVADFDGGRMTSDGGGLLLREANCCLGDLMADVLPVDWIILYEGGGSSDVRVALYDKPNWAEIRCCHPQRMLCQCCRREIHSPDHQCP